MNLKKNWKGIYKYICWVPGPRLIKKLFTGPRSHKGWETLL
jgi:hypothetical protein